MLSLRPLSTLVGLHLTRKVVPRVTEEQREEDDPAKDHHRPLGTTRCGPLLPERFGRSAVIRSMTWEVIEIDQPLQELKSHPEA